MAPAPTTPSFLRPPPLPSHHRVRLPAPPPSASFRLAEILGGRGLCNGEVGIRKELSSPTPPPSPPPSAPAGESSSPSISDEPPAVDPDAFEKEMMGLTGGFPGGEVGLKDFVAKNPPPRAPKRSQPPASTATTAVVPAERPRAPELPLFLPGMVVLVKNPANAYHMYCGIVQRVTDGRVGVLFEGGNWDRLITFGVGELEGREKGPPMVNPKSVILEALVQDDEEEAEEKKKKKKKKKEEESVAAANA